MSKPTEKSLEQAHYILKYLRGTIEDGVTFSGSDLTFISYVDASYGSAESSKSRTGITFKLGKDNGSFHSVSAVQKCVTASSAEAEYVGLFEAGKYIVWLRQLMAELGHPQSKPTTLYTDNQSAMLMAKGRGQHRKTKHVDMRYHYTRELVMKHNAVTLEYCPSKDNLADVLTKAKSPEDFGLDKKKLMNIKLVNSV